MDADANPAQNGAVVNGPQLGTRSDHKGDGRMWYTGDGGDGETLGKVMEIDVDGEVSANASDDNRTVCTFSSDLHTYCLYKLSGGE